MKLSTFLRSHQREIVAAWETFARELGGEADKLDAVGLRDHAVELLEAVANDMDAVQSVHESAEKPSGEGDAQRMGRAAARHGAKRIEQGFSLDQLVAEFRALRSSAVKLWLDLVDGVDKGAFTELIRFDEAIDQAIAESVTEYSRALERTRTLFLGVLGHDLRNPLAAIRMSAQVLLRRPERTADIPRKAGQIVASSEKMGRLIDDLLTFAEERLGEGVALHPVPVDLDPVCRKVVEEIVAGRGELAADYRAEGDLRGAWDSDRIAQMLGNLVANAAQHGEPGRPVTVRAVGRDDAVELRVHNDGPPIPEAARDTLFDPFARVARAGEQSGHLGLGLYVVCQIAKAHGGEVRFTSDAVGGTTFTALLPRQPAPAHAEAP